MASMKKIFFIFLLPLCFIILAGVFGLRFFFPIFTGAWFHPLNFTESRWNVESFDSAIWSSNQNRRAGMLGDLTSKINLKDRSDLVTLLGSRDGAYITQDSEITYSLGNFKRNGQDEACSVVAKFYEASGYFSKFQLYCIPNK